MDPTTLIGSGISAILVIALIIIYFLPTIVAYCRHHHQRFAILVVNLLFGLTVLGWAIGLIWACTAIRKD